MNPDKMNETPSAPDPSATIEIDWQGIPVTMPAAVEDWDLDAIDAFERGLLAPAIRLALGEDSYRSIVEQFKAKNGRKPTLRDVEPLMEELSRIYGFESAGN